MIIDVNDTETQEAPRNTVPAVVNMFTGKKVEFEHDLLLERTRERGRELRRALRSR